VSRRLPGRGQCLNMGSLQKNAHAYVIADKPFAMGLLWRPACESGRLPSVRPWASGS